MLYKLSGALGFPSPPETSKDAARRPLEAPQDSPETQKTTKLDRKMPQAESRPRPLPELSGHRSGAVSWDLQGSSGELPGHKMKKSRKSSKSPKMGYPYGQTTTIIKLPWIFLGFLRQYTGREIPTCGTFQGPVSRTRANKSKKVKKQTPQIQFRRVLVINHRFPVSELLFEHWS